jgi:hypothetical protein
MIFHHSHLFLHQSHLLAHHCPHLIFNILRYLLLAFCLADFVLKTGQSLIRLLHQVVIFF